MEEGAQRSFHDAVEAVRLGYITARDRAALGRWRSMQGRIQARAAAALKGQDGAGLTGAALESALRAMLVTNPDIVAVRVARG